MFYPLNYQGKFTPFILAGHCFDYTEISAITKSGTPQTNSTASRLSSATQLGIGTNINLTQNFNLTLSSQYMVHLGKDLHILQLDRGNYTEIIIEQEQHNGISLEGHLLFTISLNFKIADLW